MWLCVAYAGAIDTSTRIFDTRFRTLKVMNADDFMSVPLLRLNTNDALSISFDEIADEVRYLRYRLIHCNADWQPSQLLESEYLPGFNECRIEDYGFSSNTFIHYVNYRITIPDEVMQPLVSGNYLLQVYEEYDDENVLLQVRFRVSENVASVTGEATSKTDRGLNGEWQQASFKVDISNLGIRDPFADLIVTVEQNNDATNIHTLRHPQRVDGTDVVYEHLPELIFPSGNEYRRFETVQVVYPGLHTDSLRFVGPSYQAWLTTDQPRRNAAYQYDVTQRGRYLIREFNATDSDLGADYVVTHFTLQMPPLSRGEVYLDGEFTHHLRTPYYRMNYDTELEAYTAALPLKQGSYNYRYVVQNEGQSSSATIDGNFPETVNEYNVYVYYREPGSRADRLLGTTTFITQ